MASELRILNVGKTKIALFDRVAAEVKITGDQAGGKQALGKVLRSLNPIVGKGVVLTGTLTITGETTEGINVEIKFNQSVEEDDVEDEDA